MVEGLDLAGCIVTADALNTQEKFASALIQKKADYCLAVKQNHKSLFYDIQLRFVDRTETRTLEIEKLNSDMEELRQERFLCFREVVCLQPY